jgi:hypothetical protein
MEQYGLPFQGTGRRYVSPGGMYQMSAIDAFFLGAVLGAILMAAISLAIIFGMDYS